MNVIPIGDDFYLSLAGVRDSAPGGAYLNAGTATYTLYTLAGAAVPGGAGSLAYVAASSGNYLGTVESTVTATLTPGARYYAKIVFAQTPFNYEYRLDYVALAPGLAVIDRPTYEEFTGQSFSGTQAAAVERWCGAVREAIERTVAPFRAEPVTLANVILDAPPTRDLILPVRPARSVTSVYLRADANGQAARFTSDYLLDNANGDQYQLLADDFVNGVSGCGILRRVNGVWGAGWYTAPGTLGPQLQPLRGAVLVNYEAGPPAVPEDLRAVAVYLVTKLFTGRKTGAGLSSESWNGYSASYAAGALANLWKDDYVADLLRPYRTVRFG